MSISNLVSIVIPCYNQGHFLGEAIESVFRQTHPYYEVIVVDDGSTDNSRRLASRTNGVRCLSQRNRGLAGARNAGLAESRGSYVVFLDADDRLLPNALEDGLNALDAHPACAFTYGHVKLITGNGSPLPTPAQSSIEKDHYLELLRHNYIWTPGAVIYRRAVFDHVAAFNSRISASADFDLNARIASRFPVCCTGTTVLEYRRHEESMSRNFAHMLKAAVVARRLQREQVRGDKKLEEALKDGTRRVQEDYSEKLIRQLRNRIVGGEWSGTAAGLLTLLRYYPQGLFRYAIRKLNERQVNLQY